MVGFPDRRPQASWHPLEHFPRRKLIKGIFALGPVFCAPAALFASNANAEPKKGESASSAKSIAVDRAVFFAFAQAADVALACGERGLIAYWDASRSSWITRQLATRKNFTAMALHTEGLAAAVGHSGVIFVSQNFGKNWEPVAETERHRINPNKEALLTVAIDRNRRIIVAGAFGVMATSSDLGKSWSTIKPFGADFDLHLYHLAADDGKQSWMVTGESGTLGESSSALSWRQLPSPYQGSLFGGLFTPMGARIVFGMRGQIFRQSNAQSAWQPLQVPTTVAWMAGRALKDGRIVLVGDQGMVAVSRDDGRRFEVQKVWESSLADIFESPDQRLWVAGRSGLKAFDRDFRPISESARKVS